MIEDVFGSRSTILAGSSRSGLETLIRLAKEQGLGVRGFSFTETTQRDPR